MAKPGNDDEQVDKRFADLIRAEYGERDLPESSLDDSGKRADGSALPPLAPRPRRPEPTERRFAEPVAHRSWSAPSPTELDEFEAQEYLEPPKASSPSALTLLGWLLMASGLIGGLVLAFGAPAPRWAGVIAAVAAVAGLALLLALRLRTGPRDLDDQGIRL